MRSNFAKAVLCAALLAPFLVETASSQVFKCDGVFTTTPCVENDSALSLPELSRAESKWDSTKRASLGAKSDFIVEPTPNPLCSFVPGGHDIRIRDAQLQFLKSDITTRSQLSGVLRNRSTTPFLSPVTVYVKNAATEELIAQQPVASYFPSQQDLRFTVEVASGVDDAGRAPKNMVVGLSYAPAGHCEEISVVRGSQSHQRASQTYGRISAGYKIARQGEFLDNALRSLKKLELDIDETSSGTYGVSFRDNTQLESSRIQFQNRLNTICARGRNMNAMGKSRLTSECQRVERKWRRLGR